MKITEVTKIVCFLIETDDEDNYMYTRYGADNWTARMGESDEPLYSCEEIETLYQEWLAKNVRKCESNSINNINNIKMINKINEAFKWLNEDLIYVAMIGIVDIHEEETGFYTKESIEGQTFDHWYEESKMISEDTATGTTLIPLEGNTYMKFEFNS